MLRHRLLGCVVLLGVTAANAKTAAPAASAADARTASAPTYWVLMITGEKNGTPWIETATPATLGGIVKDTGPWACSYSSTSRGSDLDSEFEQMELTCAAAEAEVFLDVRCNFRTKPKAGKVPGRKWKRGTLQTLNLRRKGDSASTLTVSLRCDVDAAFEAP
ncbi:MAG TPA: hypothetical protein VHM25_09445 [Polyangiaceae bacterium]|jgi:hypothetical protein|nr:hypothetical protein [Polyangiaceae bacterium]